MAFDQVQFSCPACSKILAIDPVYAGRSAKCPGCGTVVAVPIANAGGPSPASPPPLFGAQNNGAQPQSLAETAPYQGNSFGAPTTSNKTLTADDLFGTDNFGATKPVTPQQTKPASKLGVSIGGFLVASIVAFVCSVVWVVITISTERELGIVAWGIGGLIGLVGGSIARNPSGTYCAIMSFVAICSIAFAKLIMIVGIMMLHVTANIGSAFLGDSPERERDQHVLVDKMIADGSLSPEKLKTAKAFNSGYFGDEEELVENPLGGVDGINEEAPDTEQIKDIMSSFSETMNLRSELNQKLNETSAETRGQWLADAKQRHPTWIENKNHLLVVLDQLLEEPDALSEGLKKCAEYETAQILNDYENEQARAYEGTVSPKQIASDRKELRGLAVERLSRMSQAELEAAMNRAMIKHPGFTPDPDAFTAVLASMVRNNEFPDDLRSHAKSFSSFELDEGFEYLEGMADEKHQEKEKAVRALVNAKIASMPVQQRKALIDEAHSLHSEWTGSDPDRVRQKLEEQKRSLPGDGTFAGSFAEVVGVIDLLWLFLGASTAFGTARKLGTPAA